MFKECSIIHVPVYTSCQFVDMTAIFSRCPHKWIPDGYDVREEYDVTNEEDEPESAEPLQSQQDEGEKNGGQKEDLGQSIDLKVN